jgi:hypothetical protein
LKCGDELLHDSCGDSLVARCTVHFRPPWHEQIWTSRRGPT